MTKINFEATTKFNFGRYRGESVAFVAAKDSAYLRWVVLNVPVIEKDLLEEIWIALEKFVVGARLCAEIKNQRERKFGAKKARNPWEEEDYKKTTDYGWGKTKTEQTFHQEFVREARSTSSARPSSPGVSKKAIEDMATRWYRESAKKWHPDLQKGNSEPMKAINDCYDRLKELIARLA